MSKITALIEELTKKQQKIDFLNYIKKGLNELDHNDEDIKLSESLVKEVIDQLNPMIDQLSKSIEDGVSLTSNPLLKEQNKVASYSGSYSTEPKDSVSPSVQPLPPKSIPEVSHEEKLDFSMKHRDLNNKQVNIISKDGKNRILGKVVGLKAPDSVIVKTDAGTVSASLSSIELI